MSAPKPDLTEVGIGGLAVYFPRLAVAQTELEKFDGVSAGKYTIGLGQTKMSVVHDNEDVVSMSLTVLQKLVEEYNISYTDIGRLEVGTETIIDKSKSIKSSLMQLFEESGNYDVEGLDNTNACYGSTAALFNTVSWMESTAWDGRYGIVVAADIAVYGPGPARPTGGAGAVAILIARGEEAPLRFEVGLRASCFQNTYDFFKPRLGSEYPTVNGQETVDCYARALDACYCEYRRRVETKRRKPPSSSATNGQCTRPFTVANDIDYCVFHAPFDKMVQRAMARLVYNDFMDVEPESTQDYSSLEKYRALDRSTSHRNRDAQRDFVAFSKPLYKAKCEPATRLARETGNAYTASLYSSLACLIASVGDEMVGARVLLFAFGSGFASTIFSLRAVSSLDRITRSLAGIEDQLQNRTEMPSDVYTQTMEKREADYCRPGYTPSDTPEDLFPGTYYIKAVDEQGRRSYARHKGPQ